MASGYAERTTTGEPRLQVAPLRFAGQVLANLLGNALFALGITMTLQAGLGLSPWDVLHQGISRHTPLSFGQANQIVGAVIIALGFLLRVRPGLGTVLNMFVIGFCIDRIIAAHVVPNVASQGIATRLLMDMAGVLVVGLGTGLYIRASLGAGPRDGLMLGLHRATGQRVAVTRGMLELSAACLGFLLGGTVGVGTLIFAFGIGPAVEVGFRLFRVRPTPGPLAQRNAAVD